MTSTKDLMLMAPVIPVVVLDDVAHAVPLAEALVRGGLPVVEITLRTPAGLGAIKAIVESVPGAVVGAGSVLTQDQVLDVKEAGGHFLVSPGCTVDLAAVVKASDLSYLPGAATPSEVMRLRELGFECQKFFPAGVAGGPKMLGAIAGPIADVTFCPTGGVSLDNATDYLSLKNVACVGGSWVAPRDMIMAEDWDGIEALAREASQLPRG